MKVFFLGLLSFSYSLDFNLLSNSYLLLSVLLNVSLPLLLLSLLFFKGLLGKLLLDLFLPFFLFVLSGLIRNQHHSELFFSLIILPLLLLLLLNQRIINRCEFLFVEQALLFQLLLLF